MVGDVLQHRPQIFEVEKQQALLVGELEGDVEHALLHRVEAEQPRHQQRSDIGDGGADRMTLLAQDIPEDRREAVRQVRHADRLRALRQRPPAVARHGDTGEIALHIGDDHRDAGLGEGFGEPLQRHGLAGPRGARDQAVAVAEREQKPGERVRLASAPLDAAQQQRPGPLDLIGSHVRRSPCLEARPAAA